MSSDDKLTDLHGHEDKELSTLYHRADKPEPPAQLDASIRAAAHAATPRRYRRPAYWLSGVAATLIVGVLVVQLYPPALQTPDTDRLRQTQEAAVDADAPGAQREQLPSAPAAAQAKSASGASRALSADSAAGMADQLESRRAAPSVATLPSEALNAEADADAASRLVTILQLLEAGELSAAQRAWDDFKKRHPDFPLTPLQQRTLSPLMREQPRQ